MTTTEFIRNYVAANPTPDPEYCPGIIFYWRTVDGEKSYNSRTGELTYGHTAYWYGERSNYPWVANKYSCRSYPIDAVYMKRIGNDILEIAPIRLNKTNRGKQGEIREWVYLGTYFYSEGRIFVDRKTMKPYDKYGNELWTDKWIRGGFYNRELANYVHWLSNESKFSCAYNTVMEFKAWSGADKARNYDGECEFQYMWHCEDFIKKCAERKPSKANHDFLSIELPEREYVAHTVEFTHVGDYGIFRFFRGNYDYTNRNFEGTAKENCRVFISEKGNVKIADKYNGNWAVTSANIDSTCRCWSGKEMMNKVGWEHLTEITPIKWIEPLIDKEKNPLIQLGQIIDLLRHPIIEKLTKAGYPNIAYFLSTDNNGTIVANAKRIFKMEKINEKLNINKMLGVNKHILKMMEDEIKELGSNNYRIRYSSYIKGVACLKYIFGENLSSLSDSTVDQYMNGLSKLNSSINELAYSINPTAMRYWYGSRSVVPGLTEEDKKLLAKLFRLEEKEPGITEAYRDSIGVYRRIIRKPEVDFLDFRHKADIDQMHDNLVALMNAEQAERNRINQLRDEERRKETEKKFKKLQEDRIALYESENDDFMMVVPKDLTELTTEGSSLHHCVGTYLTRHGEGTTNIIFLRRKDMPNTPFYTIEVDNSGRVVQIHGKYNCWLGNNPEAISFVWNWIKERNFRCPKEMLLDTASGYGSSRKYVSESYLVA